MARRYKTTTPAPVELALGLVAALVWGVSELVGWFRVLVATTAAVVMLDLAHTAVTPVRAAASVWGPMVVAVGHA